MRIFLITGLLLFGCVSLEAQSVKSNDAIMTEYMNLFQLANKGVFVDLDNSAVQESLYVADNESNRTVLKQEGVGNYSNVKAKTKSLTVNQKGEENFNEFITYYGEGNLTMDILQEGVGNSILIYGENSLINNMKIVQKSNHKDIIITNK